MNITEQKQKEQENTHTTHASTSKSSQDIEKDKQLYFERKPIANTPFVHLISEEHGHALAIGNSLATEWFKTDEEIVKIVNGTNWQIMSGLVMHLIDTHMIYKEIALEQAKRKREAE